MTELTASELELLNNISRIHDSSIYFGNIIEALIEEFNEKIAKSLGIAGTPVNAAAATATLAITGVVIDGEKVTIGSDVYEFAADVAQTVGMGCIPVDITTHVTAAVGTLTLPVQPTAGDKVTIGTKVYTFVPVGTDTADGEVSIGANVGAAQLNLVAAINGTDGISEVHPLVRAGAFAANVCTITALVGGTAGNAIATTETFTAGTNVFATGTLLTGANCTAANAVLALVATITADGTEGVTAVDGTDDTVVITAAAGAAGNSIAVSETMANGSFGEEVVALSGGLDATPYVGGRFMFDDTNLYVYVEGTWHDIVLGSI